MIDQIMLAQQRKTILELECLFRLQEKKEKERKIGIWNIRRYLTPWTNEIKSHRT